jgi:hypothetical protein
VPRADLAERTGGWRSTGTLARAALFILGLVAAALLGGLLSFDLDPELTLLFAGLVAVLASEWLTVAKRLHASGVEEGLCLAGYLLIGLWITSITEPQFNLGGGTGDALVLIAAAGAAGLRRLNPLVTTGAVIALVYWVASSATARALDPVIGAGVTGVAFGCALAALALVLGAREYRRPSHDRMLDWLVATLPVAAYAQHASRGYNVASLVPGAGTGRLVTTVLLIALAVALLIAGLRRRRHAPLLGFMGCVACLAAELRLATTLATETWLIVYGLAALIAGMALDRYLRQPRNGLTSAPLTNREGLPDLLQTAGAAVLAQRAAPQAPAPESTYTGGGGRFGGGGASGDF